MPGFLIGICTGYLIFEILTSFNPLSLRSTVAKLVELGHGDYDARTGKFVLRECKKDWYETSYTNNISNSVYWL